MKTVVICAMFAVVGLGVASCGSAHSARTLTFTSPTKMMLATADTGAPVVCRNDRESTEGTVPARGEHHGFAANYGGDAPSLVLIRGQNGSLVVNCS